MTAGLVSRILALFCPDEIAQRVELRHAPPGFISSVLFAGIRTCSLKTMMCKLHQGPVQRGSEAKGHACGMQPTLVGDPVRLECQFARGIKHQNGAAVT